jgi:hypothetical protein
VEELWTVQVFVAGEASVLPAASVALTVNVCEAALSAPYALGLVQAAEAAASSLQMNVVPDSVAVKANEALVEVLGLAGADVMVVSGAVVSAGGGGGGGWVAPQSFRPMSVPSEAVPFGVFMAYAQRPVPPANVTWLAVRLFVTVLLEPPMITMLSATLSLMTFPVGASLACPGSRCRSRPSTTLCANTPFLLDVASSTDCDSSPISTLFLKTSI